MAKDDVFLEAAGEALKVNQPIKDLRVIKSEEKVIGKGVNLGEQTELEKTAWADLSLAIKGKHAKRFNEIMESLPAREFVRVYLNSLEFFVPKIVRNDGSGNKKRDNKMQIVVHKNQKTGTNE